VPPRRTLTLPSIKSGNVDSSVKTISSRPHPSSVTRSNKQAPAQIRSDTGRADRTDHLTVRAMDHEIAENFPLEER
jgi:hypothetical protein